MFASSAGHAAASAAVFVRRQFLVEVTKTRLHLRLFDGDDLVGVKVNGAIHTAPSRVQFNAAILRAFDHRSGAVFPEVGWNFPDYNGSRWPGNRNKSR